MIFLVLALFFGTSLSASQIAKVASPKHDYTLERAKQVIFDGVEDGYRSRLKVETTLTDNRNGKKITETTYFGKLSESTNSRLFEAYDGCSYYKKMQDKDSQKKASLEGMLIILRQAVQRYCFERLESALERLEKINIDFDEKDLILKVEPAVTTPGTMCTIQ